jgi:hypothetical protein
MIIILQEYAFLKKNKFNLKKIQEISYFQFFALSLGFDFLKLYKTLIFN